MVSSEAIAVVKTVTSGTPTTAALVTAVETKVLGTCSGNDKGLQGWQLWQWCRRQEWTTSMTTATGFSDKTAESALSP